MTKKAIAVALVLLVSLPVVAQSQLLQNIDERQARRLEDYNSTFLGEISYFAARYRIVRVNTDLLLQERDITVMPFDDVKPIEIIWQETRRNYEDVITWVGRYKNDPVFDLTGAPAFQAKIELHAWDIDESENAEISIMNRFEHSPRWTFDENDNLILERAPGSDSGIAAGPPPQTPEEIERHKRLGTLNKHAFYSAEASFDLFDRDSKYVLMPLKYTPRYSVVLELIRGALPNRTEPGHPESRDSDRQRVEAYQFFRDGLPDDEGKAVRADL